MDKVQFNHVIIFVNIIMRYETLSDLLTSNNSTSKAIHSNFPQEERLKLFNLFKQFKRRIMVAIDL